MTADEDEQSHETMAETEDSHQSSGDKSFVSEERTPQERSGFTDEYEDPLEDTRSGTGTDNQYRAESQGLGLDEPIIDELRQGQSTLSESNATEPTQTKSEGNWDPEPSWEEERQRLYEKPNSELELLRQIDDFIDAIDSDLPTAKERARAGEHYKVSDRFGNNTTTQSTLGFDYVRDDGIVVDGDDYIGLSHVTPVRWLSKSDDAKESIAAAYIAFLRAIQWGISIPCYPSAFDFSTYLEDIYEEGTRAVADGRVPILDYARRKHIEWISTEINEEQVKKKEFYVIVRVDRSRLNAAMGDVSVMDLIKEKINNFRDSTASKRGEAECISEIWERRQVMKEKLERTGVEIEHVTERKHVMELLYHYYNHVKPVLDTYDSATATRGTFSQTESQ